MAVLRLVKSAARVPVVMTSAVTVLRAEFPDTDSWPKVVVPDTLAVVRFSREPFADTKPRVFVEML